MVELDDLPTDATLRRHALTERQRVLGLPPTDSVLRRHHAQQQQALAAAAAAPPAARNGTQRAGAVPAAPAAPMPAVATVANAATSAAAAPRVAPPTPPAPVSRSPEARQPMPVPAAAPAGFFGWLRRLVGI